MTAYTLCRDERLRGKRTISNLFDSGQKFFQAPYMVLWTKTAETGPPASRFAVSVPKKRFKLAVKRNLLKRRTREVFRTSKPILDKTVTRQIHIMVIYSSNTILPSSELDKAMKKILQRIARQHVEPA